jgi:hypothetical protein
MTEETHCIGGANQAQGTRLAGKRRWRVDAVEELGKIEVVDTLNVSLGISKGVVEVRGSGRRPHKSFLAREEIDCAWVDEEARHSKVFATMRSRRCREGDVKREKRQKVGRIGGIERPAAASTTLSRR